MSLTIWVFFYIILACESVPIYNYIIHIYIYNLYMYEEKGWIKISKPRSRYSTQNWSFQTACTVSRAGHGTRNICCDNLTSLKGKQNFSNHVTDKYCSEEQLVSYFSVSLNIVALSDCVFSQVKNWRTPSSGS